MAVDLSELVDNLKREVSPPGTDLFPDAADADYEGYLADSFWELTLKGYITGYTENDLIVTEDAATPVNDISRALQQLIIIGAGLNIVRIEFRNMDTLFRAKAGPAEFETRKSASALVELLQQLKERFDEIVALLPNTNLPGSVFYADVVSERSGETGQATFVGY